LPGNAVVVRWVVWRAGLPAILLLAGCSHSEPVAVASVCPYAAAAVGGQLQSSCDGTSWTAGTTELCRGHLVYRDYLYDDYGADAPVPRLRWNPTSSNASVLPSGDAAYAPGAENTADLVRFELWPNDGGLRVQFELNTLYGPAQTLALLAIDTDDDARTGGGPWPGFGVASQGWDELHVFDRADAGTNTITGWIPRPPGKAWKLWAAVGQADGTLMNVAFRGSETSEGAWFDQAQAKALAAGDLSAFAAGVCAEELDRGTTQAATVAPGLHERVYTSAYTLPPAEGISIDGIPGPGVQQAGPRVYQAFNFLGRYQPYAYYLPRGAAPQGLQLMLHGFSQTHVANISQPGFQQAFGEDLNRVLVSPLGRGLAGAYSDISERDVLDVLDDALAHFRPDAARVIVSGVSMGGYGQLAFGTLYPDRFAGMIGWVSPTGNFEVFPAGQPLTYEPGSLAADTAALVRNLRHLPSLHFYGALDEFVPAFEAQEMLARLRADDAGAFDFFLNLNTDHLTTFGTDVSREAALSAGWQRPSRVAQVTYRRDASLDVPAYGIVHDRAYWVHAIAARGEGYADVDLHSFGCGEPRAVTEDGSALGSGPPPVIWQRSFRRIASQSPEAPDNCLEGDLRNVAALRIDPAGACLSAAPLSYRLTTDGPAVIDLGDGRRLTLPAAGLFEAVF